MSRNSNNVNFLGGKRVSRGLIWGVLIISALFAFEIFNYSSTEFAMTDLLGDLSFMGMRWSTILALAFCGIDFAGIARLFTPEQGADEPKEVWYLFGAWLLAATMNASLTWWGVSVAIVNNANLGNSIIARERMLQVVPVFVAIIVWVIRVLIIGTFSVAGERIFSQDDSPTARRGFQLGFTPTATKPRTQAPKPRPMPSYNRPSAPNHRPANQPSFRPARSNNRPEPTYHPVSMQARSKSNYQANDTRDHNQDYSG
ncbi:MAG: hypothetical protein JW757_05020 [Anaerolineales bacterium]|nr:hypothetical protein [Anaerolineales bacterium]